MTLLSVYRALIRPILDYGCIAFESASPSNLKLLDTVQYKALLLVTGGLKGVALSTLLSECGELPLWLRRKEIILKYLLKLKVNPKNPSNSVLLPKAYPSLNKKFDSPFKDVVNNFLSLEVFQMVVPAVSTIAPWRCKGLLVDLSLQNSYDSEYSEKSFGALKAEDIINHLDISYPNHVIMYVDCSKCPDGKVGIGLYIPSLDIEINHRLSDHLFPYTGELIAILTGIRYGIANNLQNLVIISDCLGAVKDLSLNHSSIRPLLISSIREEIYSSNIEFTLVWVPGHLGLRPHDTADKLAKLSLSKVVETNIAYEIKEIEERVVNFIGFEWGKSWEKIQTGILYKTQWVYCKRVFDPY